MITAIILLGGIGSRLNKETPKQFIKINDKEMFLYSLETFLSVEDINKIVLVIEKNSFNEVKDILSKNKISNKKVHLCIGGKTRQESSFNGLSYIKNNFKNCTFVLIHDAARPLVSKMTIKKNITAVKKFGATSTFIDINDSIVKSKYDKIENYLNRDEIKIIQTPQAFKFSLIYKAHLNTKSTFNDDSSLIKNNGYNIRLVKGDIFNFKVTTKQDLKLLEAITKQK